MSLFARMLSTLPGVPQVMPDLGVRDWACRPPPVFALTHPRFTLPAVPQELAAAAVQLAKEGREGG